MIFTDGEVLAETVNLQVIKLPPGRSPRIVVQHFASEQVMSLPDAINRERSWSGFIPSEDDYRAIDGCRKHVRVVKRTKKKIGPSQPEVAPRAGAGRASAYTPVSELAMDSVIHNRLLDAPSERAAMQVIHDWLANGHRCTCQTCAQIEFDRIMRGRSGRARELPFCYANPLTHTPQPCSTPNNETTS